MSDKNECKTVDGGSVIGRSDLIRNIIKDGGFVTQVHLNKSGKDFYYLCTRNYHGTEITNEEWEWIKSNYNYEAVEKKEHYVTAINYQFSDKLSG